MPQLDFSTFPSQIFWLITTFFLLYFLVSNFVYPWISSAINSRDAYIKSNLDATNKMQHDAEALNTQYDKIHKQAYLDANKMFNESLKEMRIISDNKHKDLDKKIEKLKTDLQKELLEYEKNFFDTIEEGINHLAKAIIVSATNKAPDALLLSEVTKEHVLKFKQ
jgi:F-type H+-transporting ATPase subunit b